MSDHYLDLELLRILQETLGLKGSDIQLKIHPDESGELNVDGTVYGFPNMQAAERHIRTLLIRENVEQKEDECINAVRKGAAYLDVVRKNWHNEMNLDQLDQCSGRKCVVGQLYGSYWNGRDELLEGSEDKTQASYEMGFAAPEVHQEHQMTHLWRYEIIRRRHSKDYD